MIIIGKAPYRISLLGGSSDLDWFVEKEKFGVSLGYSLSRYSYSILNLLPKETKFGILKYSSTEKYSDVNDIVHPLIREALKYQNIDFPLEILTLGFASGGSGIGGSSSFLLSLLISLYKLLEKEIDILELAKIASEIEINRLGKSIGRQDQYLSAIGGLSCLRFESNQKVLKTQISDEKIRIIKKGIKNMYLVPSNMNRNADSVLKKFQNDEVAHQRIKEIRNIAENFISTKEEREDVLWEMFNTSVRDSWEIKKSLSNVMNEKLTEKYKYLYENIPNNWIRLLGAGSGGYFLISIKEEVKNPSKIFIDVGIKDFIKAEISQEGVTVNEF